MTDRRARRAGAGLLTLAVLLAASVSVCERSDGGPGAPTLPGAGGADERTEATRGNASDGTGTVGAVTAGVDEVPPREIADYGPPAPTLYFVAGLKGYTEPCGCTAGLKVGGLDRVVGFIEEARAMQPASLVIDAGNLLFADPELEPRLVEQERLKAPLMVAAHARLGTVSTTPGPYDLALGLDVYRDVLQGSGLTVVVANLRAANGSALGQPSLIAPLGDLDIGVVGAVDPALFAHRADVVAEPAAPAVAAAVAELEARGVDTVVLVMQGGREATAAVVADVPGVDFAIVGYEPDETDAIVLAGGRPLLQAYDQGRYVGILKLYAGAAGDYADARVEDREIVDRLDRRLSYLRNQLALLPPTPAGEEPAIVQAMRGEVDDLELERQAQRHARLEIPDDGGAFLYWPVALEPGYPEDPETRAAMDAYNAALRELNADRTEIVPVGPDDVAYVGVVVCATCHPEAHVVWEGTPHSRAIATLEERDKAFDESCVYCHVTGFEEPGGAVTANHNGLANVQCEQCHGPGAAHVAEPRAGHLIARPAVDRCVGCHNDEHSPTFGYDRYLPLVLGPGHGEEP